MKDNKKNPILWRYRWAIVGMLWMGIGVGLYWHCNQMVSIRYSFYSDKRECMSFDFSLNGEDYFLQDTVCTNASSWILQPNFGGFSSNYYLTINRLYISIHDQEGNFLTSHSLETPFVWRKGVKVFVREEQGEITVKVDTYFTHKPLTYI